uniref:YeeE/YedE thiosulfate transporter family protein n=1 Tax=Roseihalotalea indica TaxID=2867963 RepID=A0AA49GN65_9BACT|nr:YeeE/YedE thiosulfate transporter family protein [Tunicatimonas sp. TK19036]
MKFIKYLMVGVVFGITLAKAEVISWYRIYEMFKFQSFHMYGVIGSAVVLGIIATQIIKRFKVKSIDGNPIVINPKQFSIPRYLIGGIIFGLGWALTGACPGPMFILIGYGVEVMLIVVGAALLGTYSYGLLRKKLPH